MDATNKLSLVVALGAFVLLAPACADEGGNGSGDEAGCEGAKCDTPTGTDEECLKREAEVLSSSNRGFTPTDVRWACADVNGVNTNSQDDRGQEYCEYWAIFQPPAGADGASPEAVDLGRNLDSGTTPPAVCFPGDEGAQCRISLTDEQQSDLLTNSDAVVGACVFTSWHADVPGPVPACADGCGEGGQVFGIPFTEEFFRMKVSFNSNRAAADLVEKCAALPSRENWQTRADAYDWSTGSPDDDWQSPFFRGCAGANALFGTGWRRSDPSICAAVNRLRECGCGVPGVTTGQQLGDALVPPQPQGGQITKRGFELATWDNREGLPGGCTYAQTGEDTQSIVLCDILAADLLANADDPKEFCRATYGKDVVVHVPLPSEAISCAAPGTPEAASCGEIPWNIGAEGEAPDAPPSGDESGSSGGGSDDGAGSGEGG
jgi:hypothetical protein